MKSTDMFYKEIVDCIMDELDGEEDYTKEDIENMVNDAKCYYSEGYFAVVYDEFSCDMFSYDEQGNITIIPC